MKRIIGLLLVLVLVIGLMPASFVNAQGNESLVAKMIAYNKSLPKGYGVTAVSDLNAMLAEKQMVLLDVREVSEYEAGHLENSFNVPLRTLAKNLALLPDLNAPIMVICKGGARATYAMATLQMLGYTDVKVLKGGFEAWAAEDFPTTTDPFIVEATTAPAVDEELLAALDNILSNLSKNFDLVAPKDLAVELTEHAPILIDVRSVEEWNKGYIEGSVNIWINEFMDKIGELPADKDANLVVLCASGYRGAIVKMMLNVLGYTKVRNLNGGTTAWTTAGFPLVGAVYSVDTALPEYLKTLDQTFGAVRVADVGTEITSDNKPFIVDVRTADEYVEGHIEGSINIPLNDLAKYTDMLPAAFDANIVVVCGSGHRSAIAMTTLGLMGYTKTRSMLGGVTAWKAADLPLVDVPTELTMGEKPAIKPEVLAAMDNYLINIPKGYFVIKPADVNVLLTENPPFLLDVRGESEFAAGYVKGAVNVPLAKFFDDFAKLPADKAAPIVIYDNPTHRSSIAAVFLQLKGYTDVKVMGGGFSAWEKAGLAVEK